VKAYWRIVCIGMLTALFGVAGCGGSESHPSIATTSGPACASIAGMPKFGANLVSLGNAYTTNEYSDASLDQLFNALAAQGLRQISVRVIWQIMEPTQGVYNATAIAALNRILSKATAHGFDAMLDFHTLFTEGDQWWQAPLWLTHVAPQGAFNGETLAAGSLRQLFYVDAMSDAYLAMIQHVVGQTQAHASLKYISLLNEPYLYWNSTSNAAHFSNLVMKLLTGARTVTAKPLGIRFLSGWNPWADESNKVIGADIWMFMDYVAMNQYVPATDTSVIDGTVFWPMAQRALAQVQAAGKKFVVSETGYDTGADADYAARWTALLARLQTYKPDVVQLWNAQNDGSYFSPTTGGFNILKSKATPADYVVSTIRPALCR
jgi:hypothetical protein